LPKLMNQNAKASFRVSESSGSLFVAEAVEEISAKGFVLSMGGIGGLEEEASHIRYFI